MADPNPSEPTPRARPPATRPEGSGIPARWGFFKGLLTGAAIEIPALAATVWVLSQQGFGDTSAPFMRIMRLTTLFAGIAALFTAGGIGRLAAHAAVEGRRHAVWVAARAHAVASVGLVVIAAIPLGELPERPVDWWPLLLAGVVVGAVCGALIGMVCGGTAPVGLADVWSLARRPTDALGQLLSPRDLVKLGTALRTRTTHLFEGIFEPAARPPVEPAPPTSPAPPTEPPPPPPPPVAAQPTKDE